MAPVDIKGEFKTAEQKMTSAVEALNHHFDTLRTGRASTALLNDVRVDNYGQPVPIAQVATVSTPDARSVLVTPWNKAQLGAIEKAIQAANIGLQPQNDGQHVRLIIPPLTEERRKELGKKAHAMAEDARIAIRNVRLHVKQHLDKAKKNKEAAEDEIHKHNEALQKQTDKWIAKVDEVLKKKEKEIMEV